MDVEMYSTCSTVKRFDPVTASALAAWMPPRPRRRKKVVPTNSRTAAWASSPNVEKYEETDMMTVEEWFLYVLRKR